MAQIEVGSLFAGIGGFDLAAERAGFRVAWHSEINKYSSRVLKYRWPNIENLGDINDIKNPQWVDILVGGFPCFVAGTPVLTEGGYRPIEGIEVGDLVLTHQGRWRRVTEVMNRNAKETYLVKGQGIPGLVTTTEHPFYTRKSYRTWLADERNYQRDFADPAWVDAKDLKGLHAGQVLPSDEDGAGFSTDTWWVVGRYLGDGWTTTGRKGANSRAVICANYDEADILEKALSKVVTATRSDESVVKFYITKKWFIDLIRPLGSNAHDKGLTRRELSLPPEESRALLEGYLSADGLHGDTGYRVRNVANTVSQSLALSMALLVQKVYGVVASVRLAKTPETTVIEGRTVNQSDYYSIQIPKSNRSAFIDGRYGWKLIRTVEKQGEAHVYNIGVEEDESYIAGGAIVHNCQSYSVAGNRGGLSDDRGALWWQYHRLIDQIRPTWVVGENVPGLLSSAGGRDFETIIGSLADLGYGVAWSVLDSQYFGVAQRRRRVFIVGHSGGQPRHEVLALAEGMFGHPEPSREAQQDLAAALETRATADRLRAEQGHIIGFSAAATDPVNLEDRVPTISGRNGDQGAVVYSPEVVTALRARDHKGPAMDVSEPSVIVHAPEAAHTLDAAGPEAVIAFNGRQITSVVEDGNTPTLTTAHRDPPAIAFAQNQRAEVRDLNDVAGSLAANPGMKQQTYIAEYQEVFEDDRRTGPRLHGDGPAPTLTARMGQGGNNMPMARQGVQVRKLTPLECERLQGFPDGWTDIPKNSDTQRYKQLGNAVTVNTVEWILRGIAETYPDLYIHPKEDR